jgi:hypothetical protein
MAVVKVKNAKPISENVTKETSIAEEIQEIEEIHKDDTNPILLVSETIKEAMEVLNPTPVKSTKTEIETATDSVVPFFSEKDFTPDKKRKKKTILVDSEDETPKVGRPALEKARKWKGKNKSKKQKPYKSDSESDEVAQTPSKLYELEVSNRTHRANSKIYTRRKLPETTKATFSLNNHGEYSGIFPTKCLINKRHAN